MIAIAKSHSHAVAIVTEFSWQKEEEKKTDKHI